MKFIKRTLATIFFLFMGLIVLGAIVGDDKQRATSKPVTAMTEEERQAYEKDRLAKIEALEQEVKGIPAADYAENFRIYGQLRKLDPENQRFQQKYAYYEDKKNKAETMERYPERFVEITSFSWRKEGFGNIMEADFTIKNTLPFDVKDLEIKCTHSAPSGTVIDSNTRQIFEVFKAGQSRTIRNFNMGFINNQAERSGCVVVGVARLTSR